MLFALIVTEPSPVSAPMVEFTSEWNTAPAHTLSAAFGEWKFVLAARSVPSRTSIVPSPSTRALAIQQSPAPSFASVPPLRSIHSGA